MKNRTNRQKVLDRAYRKNRLCMTILFFLSVLLILPGCNDKKPYSASDVLLLVNSNTQAEVAIKKVIPYFNHFGIKYQMIDIATESLPSNIDPALIVIGHSDIVTTKDLTAQLESYLKKCQFQGTGILSFDPFMPANLLSKSTGEIQKDADVGELHFADEAHYITGYRKPGGVQDLLGYMSIPQMSVTKGQVIITGNDLPLLVVDNRQKGRVAQWTTQDWMYYSVLGPLGGLDDCLWKSIVWTARKPFVMQALPSIVTMRVDDVMGSGRQQWNVKPFQWVKTANKYGFKPWMGLFIYNITPEGIEELKELLPAGLATGTPHAFGRPPRIASTIPYIVEKKNPYYKDQMPATYFVPDYWYPKAIPFLSEYYDEFIFFDHNNQKPWSPETSKKIMKAVDDWYADTGILMGKYLIPHWGEINSDMMIHLNGNWGINMVGVREVDVSWRQQKPEYNLKEGKQPILTSPFRLYEDPVVGKRKPDKTTSRPSYNVSFRELGGIKFLDFSSMINDITGYEWMPDNDIEKTAERGIKILMRGLEAKALAVLFTHEADYIYEIKPENWDTIMKKVSEGITVYNPINLTTDEALKILRAFNTSEIQECAYDIKTGELSVKMSGETDIQTSVFVYTDDGGTVNEKLVEIPVFQNSVKQIVQLFE